MPTNQGENRYEQRINRVFDYISSHLDEPLDLAKLAEVACMSTYHWHRVYKAMQGESIVSTVKRLRLHKAAEFLAMTDTPIEEIAKKSGYTNLSSFNRIFKAEYGLPPAGYRKNGSHTQFTKFNQDEVLAMYQVNMVRTDNIKLATLPHKGNYMDIGHVFDKLIGIGKHRNLIDATTRSIGVYYDDPTSIAEEELRSCAGITIPATTNVESPLQAVTIPATHCVVLRYKGPYVDMHAAYDWLYAEWLLKSEIEAADLPVFEEYLNDPRDTKPADLLTDIYLPVVA